MKYSFSMVVNCFQNRIFALSFTIRILWNIRSPWLWIAFRIVSLHYRSQRSRLLRAKWYGCELLSESYLCIIVHNIVLLSSLNRKLWIAFRIVSLHYRSQPMSTLEPISNVVNCFQNRIFALSFTTTKRFIKKMSGCELLSESYLCIIVHNRPFGHTKLPLVVNCFQNRIFALSFTTVCRWSKRDTELWIAFRIVSLHYRSQQLDTMSTSLDGCELLSESYLCIIVHNPAGSYSRPIRLWIAFRIVSLHYRSQPS